MEGKYNDLDEKSSKLLRILRKNTTKWIGMLAMKSLINQFKHSMESITNKLNQVQERLSRNENKVDELLHSNINKEKNAIMTPISKTSET
jgi:CII-binding regulator of phage lambda lysogenization HflD